MPRRLSYDDLSGHTRLKAWALPLVVGAIAVPIVGAVLLGVTGEMGIGLGMAAGGLAVLTLLVIAGRAKPGRTVEVATSRDTGHRALIVAMAEVDETAAAEVAARVGDAVDVRLVVPLASSRLSRWLSAEDDARAEAEGLLARSAGLLVAAGLPVSGSLGDTDPVQALEDELRSYSADEVILLTEPGAVDHLDRAGGRLELPLGQVTVGSG